jgi:hypothetical protein
MIEKKTLNKLYEKTKHWVDSIKTEDNWCEKDEEFMEKEWVSVESLLPKLEEIQKWDITAYHKLCKLIKELKQ